MSTSALDFAAAPPYHGPMAEFVKVASLSHLPPGRMKGALVDGEPVVVYNVAGRIYATRDLCTHQSYPLSKGELRGSVVRCGLHQWEYDVTNGQCQHEPNIRVRCFEVKVEGGDVFVRLVPLPPPPPPRPASRDEA